ncbi:MAG TPA: hypothetical protein VH142_11505 [Polyangiaceae bacterium]|nr:hypothetical protein [Polyangiaceae bacterium]
MYTSGIPNGAMVRTAPAPEGPWSDGAREHPEFSSECGKKIVVGYPRNLANTANELRMAELTFD